MDSPGDSIPAAGSRDRPQLRPFRLASGWIITCTLIYAPFAFGSTPPFAIHQLNVAFTAAALLWLLDCIIARKLPNIAVPVFICGVLGLSIGWFMTWNSRYVFMLNHQFLIITPVHPHRPQLPGALEALTSGVTMVRLDALFGCLLAAVDLAASQVWRSRWIFAISCTGAAIACFGIAQQGGLVTFVATRMNQIEGEYFATFNYHGNAGAYLNLALPISLAAWMHAIESRKEQTWRWTYLAFACATLFGILANPSRGAQAVSAGILIAMGSVAGMRFVPANSPIYRRRKLIWPILVLLSVIAIGCVALSSHRNSARWRELPAELAKNSSRWQVWRVTMPMAKSAGALGHGPGSFKLLLPTSPMLSEALTSRWVLQQRIVPGDKISMWSMAHNDYLQTWVEFGWVGLLLFVVILYGGIGQALRAVSNKTVSKSEGLLMFGIVTALIGVSIHSFFDFPLQIESIQVTVVVLLGICWSKWEPIAIEGSVDV